MNQFKGLHVVIALLALSLSGCFESDKPLISALDSVTPVPEGRYTYEDTDKSPKSIIITHDGTTTLMTSIKDDGSAKIDRFLMQGLGRDYYIVMDNTYDYTLIHVASKSILEFDASLYCDSLFDLARSEGKSISEYGVAQVDTKTSHRHCKFNDLDSVKVAFAALLNSGTELPSGNTLVERLQVLRIYKRQ